MEKSNNNDHKIVVCRACDHIIHVTNKEGVKSSCPICKAPLSTYNTSLQKVAIVAIAALILILPSLLEPFLSVSVFGIKKDVALISIFSILKTDWSILLYVFSFFAIVLPIVMLYIIVLVGYFNIKVTKFLCNLYSFSHFFCMVDVFVLAILVSLIKITSLAKVEYHIGFILNFIFAILLIYCYSRCRPRRLWDMLKASNLDESLIGHRALDKNVFLCNHCFFAFKGEKEIETCPRCGKKLKKRSKHILQRVLSLLFAAIILYLPSNMYPIMFTEYIGKNMGSNIIDGVIALWNLNSKFVAIVILTASIFIPIFKILAISYLIYSVKFTNLKRPHNLSFLYRLVAFIGKWSMIDVFVVVIMTSVVRFTGLIVINPGFAIISFCSVVIITMFAAEEFDERLIWDRYYERK